MVTVASDLCRQHLEAAIGSFRLGMEGQGSEHLIGFINVYQDMMAQFSADDIQRVNPILNLIIQAQTRKDYLLVADLLEYGNIVPVDVFSWVGKYLSAEN